MYFYTFKMVWNKYTKVNIWKKKYNLGILQSLEEILKIINQNLNIKIFIC